MGPLERARELAQMIGEVADLAIWHPAWAALLGGMGVLETLAAGAPAGQSYERFLGANGGPAKDAVMGWLRGRARHDLLARARAGLAALARVDGTLPGQPLHVCVGWRDGWLEKRALGPGAPVAFSGARGVVVAPASEAGVRAVRRWDESGVLEAPAARPAPEAPTPAALAISLREQRLDQARHVHRMAWTAVGGPWTGIADSGVLTVVSSCHLVTDGFGHGRVTSEIARELAPRAALADGPLDLGGDAGATAGAAPMGVAAERLPSPALPAAAWAFAHALDELCAGASPRFTPTFQIALAPGDADDPDRLAARVVFALVSVRRGESPAAFRARLRPQLTRELAGRGALTRMSDALAAAPMPDALRRRLMGADGQPSALIPPIETLGGRGCLASLRYPGHPPPVPLVAASSPALTPTARDPRGGFTLTLLHDEQGCTASMCGTGLAATHAGARRALDAWLRALAVSQR